MTLSLTPDQTAAIRAELRPGTTLLALIVREPFRADNAATSGTLTLQFGPVPNGALAAIRKAMTL